MNPICDNVCFGVAAPVGVLKSVLRVRCYELPLSRLSTRWPAALGWMRSTGSLKRRPALPDSFSTLWLAATLLMLLPVPAPTLCAATATTTTITSSSRSRRRSRSQNHSCCGSGSACNCNCNCNYYYYYYYYYY